MKRLIFSGLMLLSLTGIAQKSAISDPVVGRVKLENISGLSLEADKVPLDQLFRITIPVMNSGTLRALPAGSCKIKVGLGSKLTIDPSFNVNTANLNQYFSWSAGFEDGQYQLVGDLVNPLPPGLTQTTLALKVKGLVTGSSTITANFLVSNHNSGITLSDSDPTNNSTYVAYTITGKASPAQITITDASRAACKINVSFSTTKDPNLVRYDVETSRDGFTYTKVKEIGAGQTGYTTNFDLNDAIKATDIFVRIKAVDKEGNYQFSTARMVSGSCDNDAVQWVLSVYPNPATDVKAVEITAKQGNFKGKYRVTILDISGRLSQVREVTLDNVLHFSYNLGTLAAGKYLIQVMNEDGSQSGVLQFEKM